MAMSGERSEPELAGQVQISGREMSEHQGGPTRRGQVSIEPFQILAGEYPFCVCVCVCSSPGSPPGPGRTLRFMSSTKAAVRAGA